MSGQITPTTPLYEALQIISGSPLITKTTPLWQALNLVHDSIQEALPKQRVDPDSDVVFNSAEIAENLVVAGDLEVRGSTVSTDVENIQSGADYIVLRANNPVPLPNNEYAGVLFHNYNAAGKDAVISVDNTGTLRLSTQTTESLETKTDTWLVGNQYFAGSTRFSQATGLTTNKPVVTFEKVYTNIRVYYSNNTYYFYNPDESKPAYYTDLIFTGTEVEFYGSPVAFSPLPTAEPRTVLYYKTITFTELQSSDMEPIATRSEEGDLPNDVLLKWDNANHKIVSSGQTIASLEAMMFLAAHPVHTLYWTSDPRDPGEVYGGTWTRIKDAFVYAAGDDDTVDPVDATPHGSKTHTITTDELPVHTHAIGGSTGIESRGHVHYLSGTYGGWASTSKATVNNTVSSINSNAGEGADHHGADISGRMIGNIAPNAAFSVSLSGYTSGAHQNHTHSLPANTGNNTTQANAMSIMPPNVIRYCWERIA